MSQYKIDVCTCILRECFNEKVEKVGNYLAVNGPSPLRLIASKIGLRVNETQTALRFLIKNNLVTFNFDSTKRTVLYSANLKNILAIIRCDRYVNAIRTLYGHEAELIVRELFSNGQMTLVDIITSVLDKLDRNYTEKRIYEKFVQLVQTLFVQQCPTLLATTAEDDLIPQFKISETQMYDVPSFSSISEELETRKQASEPTDKQEVDAAKDGVGYWRINIDRFNEFLRDQAIVRAIASRVHPQASDVVRTLLCLSEVKNPEAAKRTVEVSYYEILGALLPEMNINKESLENWLKVLTDVTAEFIQKEGDGGGGQYSVYFQRGFAELCKAHIESVVQERYGSAAKRILRIVMTKKRVEMSQIELLAKIDPREATGIVYRLMGDNFISVSEVARSSELIPKYIFFCFYVDLNQVVRMLLERCYKTLANLITRRMHEARENKRLIDKEQRMLAILAQIDDPEEKEEFQQQLTPAERAQLEKFNHATFMLMRAEQEVDETIFILETHLAYTVSK